MINKINPATHFTKENDLYIIREVVVNDAENILQLVQNNLKESDFLLTTPQELNLSIAQEKLWINNHAENESSLLLLAEINKKPVAICNLTVASKNKQKHLAVLGISISEKWQNKGIGKEMINTIIKHAKEIPTLEIIQLSVSEDNKRAIHLYKQLGFVKEGIQKNAIKYHGKYQNLVLMALNVQ